MSLTKSANFEHNNVPIPSLVSCVYTYSDGRSALGEAL